MNGMTMYKVKPLNSQLKARAGEEMYLTADKAKRLQKKGLVKIICAVENAPKVVIRNRTESAFVINDDYDHGRGLSIPLIIPYAAGGKIAFAYNEAMQTHVKDWAIFLDHDCLLVNPMWYDICCNAINKVGHEAGWITCYTNRIGCHLQLAPNCDRKSDNIRYHREYARDIYNENRGRIKDCTHARGGRFSGMFILTHRKAWESVGGFNEKGGFFGVDTNYFTRLKQGGYKVMLMQDLYVYHGYFREVKKPYFTKGVV